MFARVANLLLGIWLVTSAFLWPHARVHAASAEIVSAVVVAAAAAAAAGRAWGRIVTSLAGGWLIVSALVLGSIRTATFWNHMLVGFAIAMFAMMGSGLPFDPTKPRARASTLPGRLT